MGTHDRVREKTSGITHPRFPEQKRGFAELMRLSLKEKAHVALSDLRTGNSRG
jgi:hypothetical protein